MPILSSSETPRRAYGVSSGDEMPDTWRNQASCRDVDPELFFPIGTSPAAKAQVKEAKKVCRGCDVMSTCLAWALDSGQESGVWGGLSEDERLALKRRNARAARRQGVAS